jgi:Fusaric acid resistance protein-like
MPFSITPVPFEWFRKVLAPAHSRLEPMQSPTVRLLDFKLLRKSGSVLSRSRESLDPRMTADSQLRISGSALASVGAVEANYFGANLAAFILAVFFVGLLSFGFRLEKTAYRYASVPLTIIVLIPRSNPAWIVALHRFIEVSVGIIVALLVVARWPERHPVPTKSADE